MTRCILKHSSIPKEDEYTTSQKLMMVVGSDPSGHTVDVKKSTHPLKFQVFCDVKNNTKIKHLQPVQTLNFFFVKLNKKIK